MNCSDVISLFFRELKKTSGNLLTFTYIALPLYFLIFNQPKFTKDWKSWSFKLRPVTANKRPSGKNLENFLLADNDFTSDCMCWDLFLAIPPCSRLFYSSPSKE